LNLHGVVYPKGLGMHSPGRVQVWLGKSCRTFHAALGIDQESYPGAYKSTVVYKVLADGEVVYTSGVIDKDTPTQVIDVPIAGARRLALVVEDGGDGNSNDHADWADAHVTCG
jgi:beta-galactosidase